MAVACCDLDFDIALPRILNCGSYRYLFYVLLQACSLNCVPNVNLKLDSACHSCISSSSVPAQIVLALLQAIAVFCAAGVCVQVLRDTLHTLVHLLRGALLPVRWYQVRPAAGVSEC